MASPEEDWRAGKSLQQCNAYMLNNSAYHDVTFQLKDAGNTKPVTVTALKALLVARSSVFEKMFCGALAETRDVIPITDIDPPAFLELLRYIYTDAAQLSEEIVMQVMYAANKYLVTGLAQQCERFLEQRLNASNAAELLDQSLLFDAQALQARCLRTIQTHSEACLRSEGFLEASREVVRRVLESDELAAPEINVFEACVAWAERKRQREGGSLKATLGELLYLVRFPTMSAREFSDRVLQHVGLLEDGEALAVLKHITSKDKSAQLPFNKKPRTNPSARSPSGLTFGGAQQAQCQICRAPKKIGVGVFGGLGNRGIGDWSCHSCGASNSS